MLKLRTIYSHGLNQKVTHKKKHLKLKEAKGTIKGILFPTLSRHVERLSLVARNVHNSKNNFDAVTFIDVMKNF